MIGWVGVAAVLPQAVAGYAVDVRVLDRSAAKPASYRMRLVFEQKAFSVDTTSLRGRPSALLGRQDDALVLLDRQAQTYMSLDLQALTGASSMMRSAGAILGSGLGAEGPPAGGLTAHATGQSKTIGGLPCQLHQIKRGKVTIQELWVTPWDQVAAPRESFDLIRQVAASWSTLAPILAAGSGAAPVPMDGLLKVDGFPVLFTQFAKGKPIYEARFGAPVSTPTRAADFAAPGSYKRVMTLPPAARR